MKRVIYILTFLLLLYSVTCCYGLMDNEVSINQQAAYCEHSLSPLTRAGATIEYMGHRYAKTDGPLTVEKARVMYKDSTLAPTHMALRIVPANMDELHRLEADKSLQVQYHPFGFKLLPNPSDWITVETGEPIRRNLIQECETTSELMADLRKPDPIYVLWPVMHPIPHNLNYELLFDVFLPVDRSIPDDYPVPSITGYLRGYDNRLGENIPLSNVKIEYQNQILISTSYTYTDENGHFILYNPAPDPDIVIKLQNDKFVIRDSISSNVKSFALDIDDFFYENLNNDYAVNLPTNFYLDVYKGAEYYFYGENDLLDCIPKYDTLGVSIDIHAIDMPGTGDLFDYFTNYNPQIIICNHYKNNYTGASSYIFGNVLHELGSASQYAFNGYINTFLTDYMIIQSFSSFVGWYNVYQYYSSCINSNLYLVGFICSQSHQNWIYDSSNYYERTNTPFYVDLYDDFNQYTQLTYYNDDPISNVPIPFIVSSALGPHAFQDVCDTLATGIGVYYTADELSRFLAPYSVFIP